MRQLAFLLIAACALQATDKILPLDVRYRVVKRAAQVAARERQVAKLRDEIAQLNEENRQEIKQQREACKGGEVAADASDELVCRTPEAKK